MPTLSLFGLRRMKHSKLSRWFLLSLAAVSLVCALYAGRLCANERNDVCLAKTASLSIAQLAWLNTRQQPIRIGLTSTYPQQQNEITRQEIHSSPVIDWQEAMYITAVLAAVLALVILWNITLRRQVRSRTKKLNQELSARIAAERELTLQRDRAQMYLDIAAAIIMSLDENGNVTLINKKGASILGLAEEHIIGKNWFENFIPADLRTQMRVVFSGILAGRQVQLEYYENPVLCAGGKEKLIAWHNTFIRDAEGKIVGTLSSGQCVTKQQEAAQQLRESQRALATLIGNLSGIAYRCQNSPDWPMEFISRGCLEMTGYSDQQFLSSQIRWNDIICPDDRQMVWDGVQAAIAEKEPYQLEYRIRAANGEEKWLWEKGCGIFNPDGSVQALEGFISDITAMKKDRQALQFFQFAVEHAAEAAFWMEKDSRLIYVNDTACRHLGYTGSELLAMTVHDFDPDFQIEVWPKHWQELKEKGSLRFESSHRKKNGVIIPVEITANFVRHEGKEYNCAFARDISDRKKAEAAREKLLKELQIKNEELESIIYIASHDLKSPLINIQGFAGELKKSCDQLADLLKRAGSKPDGSTIEKAISHDIPESLSFIVSGAAKMDSLLSGLLRLARIGRVSVSVSPVDMNKLMENLLRTFEYQMRRQQAHIEVADLPACMGGATLISQVFSNLIDNALKYCRPDVPPQIRIEGKVENDRAVFAVIDNGIGIDPQHNKKIFEIFHQLQPANSSGGQGLGLTIVRRILNRLDGNVWVQSEQGKGSTFFVELPAPDKPAPAG